MSQQPVSGGQSTEIRVLGRRAVDLSQTIYHMQPVKTPGVIQPPAFWNRLTHDNPKRLYPNNAPDFTSQMRDMLIGEHTSTHVDALCHYVPTEEGLCLEQMSLDWFITSAICVDLSHKLPAEFIEPADLEEALAAAQLAIQPGDTFLYHQNYYQRQPEPYPDDWTGLSWAGVHWLADRGVVNIGCETASIDNSLAMKDVDPCFPAHRACRDRLIINTENLGNLSPVVGKRFIYIGLPLKIRGGTGCPIRAVALLEE